jgi:hypothetical protein
MMDGWMDGWMDVDGGEPLGTEFKFGRCGADWEGRGLYAFGRLACGATSLGLGVIWKAVGVVTAALCV